MEYEETPFFRHSASCAAHLINVVLPPIEYPGGNAKLYAKVLYAILACAYAAHEESRAMKLEPSDN